MATKYTFLKSWAGTFLTSLTALKALDDYCYTYRPGGPLGARVSSRIYSDTVKSRDAKIKDVARTSLTLQDQFVKNGIDAKDYGPIVAGLNALIEKPDLTVSTNVQRIIDFVRSYLL